MTNSINAINEHTNDRSVLLTDDEFAILAIRPDSTFAPRPIRWLRPGVDLAVEYLPDRRFLANREYWKPYGNAAFGVNYDTGSSIHRLSGSNTLYISQDPKGQQPAGYLYTHPVYGTNIPLQSPGRLELSVLASPHRCTAAVIIEFTGLGGASVGEARLSIRRGGVGGTREEGYQKPTKVVSAPSEAVAFSIKIEKGAGFGDKPSHLFVPDISMVQKARRRSPGVTALPVGLSWPATYKIGLFSKRQLSSVISEDEFLAAPRGSVLSSNKIQLHSQLDNLSPNEGVRISAKAIPIKLRNAFGLTTKVLQYVNISVPSGTIDVASYLLDRPANPIEHEVRLLLRSSAPLDIQISASSDQDQEKETAGDAGRRSVARASCAVSLVDHWHELALPLGPDSGDLALQLKAAEPTGCEIDLAHISIVPAGEPRLWNSTEIQRINGAARPDIRVVGDLPGRVFKAGVTVVTPTGDRSIGLDLLGKWMAAQSVQPDQWLIVDDGRDPYCPDGLPPHAQYLRRERSDADNPHTLSNQLLEALRHVEYDKLIIMEDDDWYRSDYIDFMSQALQRADLCGLNTIHYYQYYARRWKKGKPQARTSLAQTGFGARTYPYLAWICSSDIHGVCAYGLVDRFMWRHARCSKYLIHEHQVMNVGFKGTPGRPGLAAGHKQTDLNYQTDYDLEKLHSLVGNDIAAITSAYGRLPRGVIYTAVPGSADAISDPEHVISGVDYVCFTDAPHRQSGVWRFRPVMSDEAGAITRAKHPKIQPHKYFSDYQWSLWVDPDVSIKGSLEAFIVEHLSLGSSYAFKHPYRDCIYQEAAACIEKSKDQSEIIEEQVARYRSDGFPDKVGMAECKVLLRRHNDADVVRAMDQWWSEVIHASASEQLSHRYALWKTGQGLELFFGGERPLKRYPRLQWIAHPFYSGKADSRIIYSAEEFPITKRLATRPNGDRHSISQIVPMHARVIRAVSFKVATHKGRAGGSVEVRLFGVAEDGSIRPLATAGLDDLRGMDNKYVVVEFDEVDVSEMEALLVEIDADGENTKPPVSFFYNVVDEMSFGGSPLYVDGVPIAALATLAIQGA